MTKAKTATTKHIHRKTSSTTKSRKQASFSAHFSIKSVCRWFHRLQPFQQVTYLCAFVAMVAAAVFVFRPQGPTLFDVAEITPAVNYAIRLPTGKSDFISALNSMTASTDLSVSTIEFWFRPQAFAQVESTLLHMHDDSHTFRIVWNDPGIVNVQLPTSSIVVGLHNQTALSLNHWHHVAFTVDYTGHKGKLFIDGQLVDAEDLPTSVISLATLPTILMGTDIGADGSYINNYHGDFEDVRLSSSVRYTTTFTPPAFNSLNDDAATLILWKFNQDGTDSSSHQITAQLVANPTFINLDTEPYVGAGCKIGGCSGQLCVAETASNPITTCDMQPEYACYHNSSAQCEKQSSNQCGWTQSEALLTCINSFTHHVCQNNQCVQVSGVGENTCTTDTQCAPAQHHACNTNNQCVVVDGSGTDTCTTDTQCVTPQHHACNTQNQCVVVAGAGSDSCTTNATCISQHHVCSDTHQCVTVNGPGENSCVTSDDCGPSHTVCNEQHQCVKVKGEGHSDCSQTSDCISNNNNNSSGSSNSSNQSPMCQDETPKDKPDIYQADTTASQVTLYFVPAGYPYTDYVIEYGENNQMQHSTTFGTNRVNGALSATINALKASTIYSFKVRALNRCQPGNWSDTFNAQTTNGGSRTFYKGFAGFVRSSLSRTVLGTTTSNQKTSTKTSSRTTSTTSSKSTPVAQQQPAATATPIPSYTPPQPIPWWQRLLNFFMGK